jgi:outer membrane protein OmpA-like peptidoglycan-associated protein
VKCAALRLLSFFCFWAVLCLNGCATQNASQKSVIVLLPEAGKVSGAVTVTSAEDSQLLDQSWQSVAISGSRGEISEPAIMGAAAVHSIFGPLQGAMPAPPVHFLLYFQLDSAELLPESRSLLPEIVTVIKKRSPVQLSVVGHADTVGSVSYNQRLGLQRAAAVVESIRQLLAAREGAPARMETSSRGKTDLLVKTPDQVPEPRNRRVEVTVR